MKKRNLLICFLIFMISLACTRPYPLPPQTSDPFTNLSLQNWQEWDGEVISFWIAEDDNAPYPVISFEWDRAKGMVIGNPEMSLVTDTPTSKAFQFNAIALDKGHLGIFFVNAAKSGNCWNFSGAIFFWRDEKNQLHYEASHQNTVIDKDMFCDTMPPTGLWVPE